MKKVVRYVYGSIKKYLWDELRVKRIEQYEDSLMTNGTRKGVTFSKRNLRKPNHVHPAFYAPRFPFMSYFYVYFTANKRRISGTQRIELPEEYPVDEEEFMEKMRLWHIGLENCTTENK